MREEEEGSDLACEASTFRVSADSLLSARSLVAQNAALVKEKVEEASEMACAASKAASDAASRARSAWRCASSRSSH